jgi:hypothetical protein
VKRLVIAALVLAGVIVACKQGKGDRCQIDSDCTDGLLCNKATNTCQETTGGGIDATVPDAPTDSPDAPPDT